MFIHQNLKRLRQKRGLTQAEAALAMEMSRSQLAGYEASIRPTLEALLRLSDFYQVSADDLLRTDLASMGEKALDELCRSQEVYWRGNRIRILTTTVHPDGREPIEAVSEKAKAGYTAGYADPDYIEELPRFSLPILPSQRKYRSFQTEGDSMLPIPSGAWVIAEYLDDWSRIKDGAACVVVTRNEGIVFKLVYKRLEESGSMLLVSRNPHYAPYSLSVMEISEIWIIRHYLLEAKSGFPI